MGIDILKSYSLKNPFVKLFETLVLLFFGSVSFILLSYSLVSPLWIQVKLANNKIYTAGLFYGCINMENKIYNVCSSEMSFVNSNIANLVSSFILVALVGMLIDVFVIIMAFYHRIRLLSFSIIFHTIVEIFLLAATFIINYIIILKIYPKNYVTIQSLLQLADSKEFVLMENLYYKGGVLYLWICLVMHIFLLILKIVIFHYQVNNNCKLYTYNDSPPPYKE